MSNMSKFSFPTDEMGQAFCREVVEAMMLFFGITEKDAIERVNQHWQHTAIAGEHIVYHETPDHWAKWIFYGKAYWKNSDHNAEAALSRLERKVNLLLDHLGLQHGVEPAVSDEVRKLIGQGKTFDALKQHRRESGVDLQEANRVVSLVAYQMAGARRP